MKNKLLGIAIAILASTQAQAGDRDVFSFMGQDTEQSTTMTSLNGNACTVSRDKPDETECKDFAGPMIAGQKMQYLIMTYNRGRLYMIISNFSSDAYPAILSAFETKYGKPDGTENEKWVSRSDTTLDNPVTTWTFKGGRLKLEAVGAKLGTSSFDFLSNDNAPAQAKAKVDF